MHEISAMRLHFVWILSCNLGLVRHRSKILSDIMRGARKTTTTTTTTTRTTRTRRNKMKNKTKTNALYMKPSRTITPPITNNTLDKSAWNDAKINSSRVKGEERDGAARNLALLISILAMQMKVSRELAVYYHKARQKMTSERAEIESQGVCEGKITSPRCKL